MLKRIAVTVFALLASSSVSADTLSDVKSALQKLSSNEPVHGTLTIDEAVASSGKYGNNNAKRVASAEVVHDERGVSITIPSGLVDKFAAEGGTQDAIGSIRTTAVVEALNQRDVLLSLLDNATVMEDKRVMFNAHPTRVLVLQIKQKKPRPGNSITIGSVKSEDKLRLWLGDDLLPIAGERDLTTTAGFLFLHGTFSGHTKYTFARARNRIVLARMEVAEGGSGVGQKVERKSVQTLTLH